MKRNWEDIKWIFEPNGALRDIYVQETSIKDWGKIIDLINEKYEVNCGDTGEYKDSQKIDKNHVIEYLIDETGEKESKSASIVLGKIKLNCHFFLEDQIEFDIDPNEINSIEDFELIKNFMTDVSKLIDNQITLTDENIPQIPLVKIDVEKGLYRILTEDEMKLFPKNFTEKLLKSANEPYKSTKKDKNLW